MRDDERVAFFINVYNALSSHANILISSGLHRLPVSDKGLIDHLVWGSLGYMINGQKYSLHDIKHGILRGTF